VIDAKLLSKIPMLSEKKQHWSGAPKAFARYTSRENEHITNTISFNFCRV
jgi:hypothetical protein